MPYNTKENKNRLATHLLAVEIECSNHFIPTLLIFLVRI